MFAKTVPTRGSNARVNGGTKRKLPSESINLPASTSVVKRPKQDLDKDIPTCMVHLDFHSKILIFVESFLCSRAR